MKEIKTTIYEVNDDKVFNTEKDCLTHEAKEVLRAISEMCKSVTCHNCMLLHNKYYCPLNGKPNEWKSEVFKE